MKKIIWILVLVVVVVGVLVWGKKHNPNNAVSPGGNTSTQSLSDGVVELKYPSDFSLAVTQEQILVKSYIPPCDESFNYCLYYNGVEFEGTNFESAGIRISKRTDLVTEKTCLNTLPTGRTDLGSSTKNYGNYSASIFSPISDAGAGHYASGEIYRVYITQESRCYELETRIGETNYDNYPTGTIKKFVEADRNVVYDKFKSLLGSLKISSTGEGILLPDSEN